MSTPAITVSASFLPHDDPDAAVAFYRDVLGFEVRQHVEHGELHWITVGPPGRPEVSVVLHPPGAVPGITDDERRVIAEMMAKGTFASLLLATADIDGAFAAVQGHDVEVVSEPTDQPWGVRDFAIRDPAGTMIRVQQLP